MGKRTVRSEGEFKIPMLPNENDVIGIATKMLGFDRVLVSCQDGKERLCRIRGKMKRRMWIRKGDIPVRKAAVNPVCSDVSLDPRTKTRKTAATPSSTEGNLMENSV